MMINTPREALEDILTKAGYQVSALASGDRMEELLERNNLPRLSLIIICRPVTAWKLPRASEIIYLPAV